ncbi:MAG: DUF6902 family protein [Primorskyibacter sp.]
MSNVISLSLPQRAVDTSSQFDTLARCFAQGRRTGDDVFWLKENAELLNISQTGGLQVASSALEVYTSVYEALPRRFSFFPQYYRFLLSICLDLEDLGLPGNVSETLIAQTVEQDLPGAELSDLQRAEARRLLARRGAILPGGDLGLDDRLRAFAARSATFALPNKKAAYELTHIVFYLSDYGRRDPDLPLEALTSLHYAGLLAFLEANVDLLAEICISLRFAGQVPPAPWEAMLNSDAAGFDVTVAPGTSLGDDYHAYLITHWLKFLAGSETFEGSIPEGSLRFTSRAQPGSTALRELSMLLFECDSRLPDWGQMRPTLEQGLSPDAWSNLSMAAQSTPMFEGFFEGFARADNARAAVAPPMPTGPIALT